MESAEPQVGGRLGALETRVAGNAQAMHELQKHSARMGQSLALMVATLDRLTVELERRQRTTASTVPAESATREAFQEATVAPGSSRPKKHFKVMWMALPALLLTIVAGLLTWQFLLPSASVSSVARESQTHSLPPTDQARQYTNAREYAKAEEIYRGMLAKNPKDAQAIKALASVLFRQDKIEESANVLKALSIEEPATGSKSR